MAVFFVAALLQIIMVTSSIASDSSDDLTQFLRSANLHLYIDTLEAHGIRSMSDVTKDRVLALDGMPRVLARKLLIAAGISEDDAVAGGAKPRTCKPWCTAECKLLNGDFFEECRGCDETHACRPGAAGFPDPTTGKQDASPPAIEDGDDDDDDAAPAVRTFGLPPYRGAVQRCQRVSLAEIERLTPEQRATLLSEPTLVTGLDWTFRRDVEDAKAGEIIAAARRNIPHPGIDISSDRWRNEYFLRELDDRFPVPAVLARASASRVVSVFHDSIGVRFREDRGAPHGLSWIGLLTGTKYWYFADFAHAPPEEPRCPWSKRSAKPARLETVPGATHDCIQRVGEVVVTPSVWWHATCNDGFTVAIGGQARQGAAEHFSLDWALCFSQLLWWPGFSFPLPMLCHSMTRTHATRSAATGTGANGNIARRPPSLA